MSVNVKETYVPIATSDMPAAEIERLRKLAEIQVVEMREQAVAIDVAERANNAKTPGANPEATVYGNLIAGALGLDLVSNVADFVGTRNADHRQERAMGSVVPETGGARSRSPKTMDQHLASGNREPGLYRFEQSPSIIGETRGGSLGRLAGEALFMSASTASKSLREQGGDAVKTWKDIPPTNMMPGGLKRERELTMAHGYTNEKALDAAIAAQKHQAMMGLPGMNLTLGGGPRGPTSAILHEPVEGDVRA